MFITSSPYKSSDTCTQIINFHMNWTMIPCSFIFFKIFFVKSAVQSDFMHQNNLSEANTLKHICMHILIFISLLLCLFVCSCVFF